MARLILVTEKISDASWNLAVAMSQQYEVNIVTSRGQTPQDARLGIEVMASFKNWSFAEAMKVIPYLLRHEQQIWHFWEPNNRENQIKPAHFALALFAKAQPKDKLIVTLHSMGDKPRWNHSLSYFLKICNAVLTQDYEELHKMRGMLLPASRKTVIPPFLVPHLWNQEISETELNWSVPKNVGKIILIPMSAHSFFETKHAFEIVSALLTLTDNTIAFVHEETSSTPRQRRELENKLSAYEWHKQILWAPMNLDKFLSAFHDHPRLVWLAGQRFSDLELYNFLAQSLEYKCPLVLDTRQVDMSSFVWQKSKNCWVVLRSKLASEAKQIAEAPTWELPIFEHHNKQSVFQQLRDKSVNELSRLYSQLLYSRNEMKVR